MIFHHNNTPQIHFKPVNKGAKTAEQKAELTSQIQSWAINTAFACKKLQERPGSYGELHCGVLRIS
jgi:hypothetical protein